MHRAWFAVAKLRRTWLESRNATFSPLLSSKLQADIFIELLDGG